MKVIESLLLQNFQAHTHKVVEFGNITTIMGQSDRGKSAIFRALRWACLNALAGNEFIRHGASKARVVVYFHTQPRHRYVLKRIRGHRNPNIYKLNGKVFRSFGTGKVPDVISKVLALSPLNFQAQHDSPFWFSESAAEVSRQLNAVIDLSVIDDALTSIATEVRRSQERISIREEELEKQTKDLAELEKSRVEERIASFKSLVIAKDLLDKRVSREKRLTGRIAEWETLDAAVSVPPPTKDLDQAYQSWKSWLEQEEHLHSYIQAIEQKQDLTRIRRNDLKTAEILFHEQTKDANCPICNRPLNPSRS